MNDFAHPFIVIHHSLKNYHDACNKQDFAKAVEYAETVNQLSKELLKIAKANANKEI